jgi:hypothetical protein
LWAMLISHAGNPAPRPRYWSSPASARTKVREVSSSASLGLEVRESR